MADSSQRTEKPTPRRLVKAREQGDFPAAREFVSAVQFLAFIVLASNNFPQWLVSVQAAFRLSLRRAYSVSLTPGDLCAILVSLSGLILRPLAALGAALVVITLAIHMAATNFGFSFNNITPKFERLAPGARLSRLPGNNIVALFQALFMIPMMGLLIWTLVHDRLAELERLPLISLNGAATIAAGLIRDAMRKTGYLLFMIGAVILMRERFRYAARLRMSKQEIREEAKETDGNPNTKARVRRLQRDMRRRNMMREVRTATAVVVNPTHYAVAIRYDRGQTGAPVVVAKGKNYLAARIRLRAVESQVPIIENPPLAQALYKTVEVGQEIPAQLYHAVAEVLAYIFRLMERSSGVR